MKTKISMAALLSGLVLTAGAVSAENHRERPDFATLDANGDGALTVDELHARGAARFAQVDLNGDGSLSTEEMVAAAEARSAGRVARMIERHDENGDGLLQQDELPTRGRGRAERMFERADANDDGTISEEEFELIKERVRAHRGSGRRDRG